MGQLSSRDIDDVVDEIAQIKAENIYIADDDFLYDTDRLNRFVKEVRRRGIHKKYICYGRADYIARNPDMMKKLRDIGLYYVLVGLEAIEDCYLERYEKHSDIDDNIQSILTCNELGIHIMGMCIRDRCTPTYERYSDRMITDNPSHFDYLHLVARPEHMSVRSFYFHYYILLIRLFLKAKREGVYDFIDYGDYIRSFVANMLHRKRRNDDE